ncbi:hypothetical protein [Caloramator australicus]|jgi:hypothetical protein|uniref:Uncharacterized protein n=1 Tax=Caloramator australicus RC3 TaxID=857293 RepID=I7LHM3_9CLOT|nr:hypothetical protein [Caloramator australicus]CCJ34141.1 hypothetical protein CAAU_2057 [Caloramator australicus RC3]
MKRTIFLSLIFLVLFTSVVFAHKPIFETRDTTFEKPIVVKDHTISYAIYGSLDKIDDVDFVKFEAKNKDPLFVQMTIPIIKGNEDFSPSFAIIGKGIKQRDKLPFDIPEGYGSLVIKPSPKEYFYEKFTQTKYYIRQTIRGEIPEDGEYYVAVFSDGEKGKYSLAIGEKEKFTVVDWLKMPFIYVVVKYFFNPFATVAVIGFIIILIFYIVKRRRA